MAKIAKIIVHCSDTPSHMDIGRDEIKKWHLARGFTDIGYHRIIRRDGQTEIGRFENGDSILEGKEIGAHVRGQNSDSLALCIVGRGEYDIRQICSMFYCLSKWMKDHGLSHRDVYGHYEFDKGKTCPNLDMSAVRNVLKAMVVKDSVI